MQRSATKLSDVAQLALLPTAPEIVSRPVAFERIYQLTSTHDALMYACELARRPDGSPVVPKMISAEMGRDKTAWSRITSGEWDLDGRDIWPLSKVVKNDAYLMYLNHQHGYDLASMRKTMDDKDRRIAELEARCAAAEQKYQTVIEYERQKEGRK